ncbi:hypothetical protein BDM02DRAFT_3186472 [Thelephora ganbajun]|uniref:Uncharacterized protein n=1 Tax=Thelephora ganbajun TaxID=370292 RepID=A0ACB6ZHZ0_THEGA|nr:hypothetical protein BDM02DRAFT_3186472 [Thelephora ganbajun]
MAQGTSSELAMFSRHPPTDASQEGTDPIKPGEYQYTPQTVSPHAPPLRHRANPKTLSGVPEKANNAYHQETPLPHTPSSGQGLNGYQDAPGGGAEAYALEGFASSPWHPNLFQYQDASSAPSYPHDDAPYLDSNCSWMKDYHFSDHPAPQYSSTLPAETPGFEYGVNEFSGFVSGWQDTPTAVGFSPDDQHLSAEPNYNYVPYDGEERRFLDSEETGRSHPAATVPQPHFDHIQATSEPVDLLLSHPVGVMGNQGTSQVPVELLSVETEAAKGNVSGANTSSAKSGDRRLP